MGKVLAIRPQVMLRVEEAQQILAECKRVDEARAVRDYVAHASAFVPNDPGATNQAGGWEQLQWNFVGPFGVDAPDATNAARHDLQITRAYEASLPPFVREHLTCRVVETLEPIVQAHTIEGLMMGEA